MMAVRRLILRSFWIMGGAFASLLVYLAAIQLTGNFHEVRAGELFRSAQPSGAMIETFAAEYGGRSVINLRGAAPGAPWYEEERAASRDLGLVHIDFAMSAERYFPPERAEQLIEVMKNAPKPLLIHCRSGSDRTGLASMLYLMALTDVGEDRAERELSIRYGHIGVPILSAAWPMDESWEAFELAIGITDS